MNHETWIKLTPEQQRIKVAELCGWERVRRLEDRLVGLHPMLKETDRTRGPLLADWEIPDYLNDLNAMHEAEQIIKDKSVWAECLLELIHGNISRFEGWYSAYCLVEIASATAAQRAEIFVLTMEPE